MNAPPSLFRHAHWVLFGLLLSLALSFWLGGAMFGKTVEETYIDQHRFKALRSFERAIELQAPGAAYPALTAKMLEDKFTCASAARIGRLLRQLQAIEAKLARLSEPPKVLRFNLEHWDVGKDDCEEVLEMAAWLAADQGRRLDLLDWPGLWKARADTAMRVPDGIFRQDNPWRGADGCVYFGPLPDNRLLYLKEQRGNSETCPAMAPPGIAKAQVQGIGRTGKPADWPANDPAWGIPEDLGTILSDLGRIRTPKGIAYGLYTREPEPAEDAAKTPERPQPHGPNRIPLRGRDTEVGFNVYLTIDPAAQAKAQQWAACYSGNRHACDLLGLEGSDKLLKLAAEMYETAAVRMAAVAIIDIASGKIEALGSAHTACYQQDHDGPKHDAACPDAPFRPRYDTGRLPNHALFVDALPASTVKPIMALGFLLDNPAYRDGEPLKALWHDLKTSNSKAFLDRLFCGDATVAEARRWLWKECQRPQRAQEAARLLGWNLGCGREAGDADCAKLDLLFGRPANERIVEQARKQPLSLPLLYGRLFTEPSASKPLQESAPDLDWTNEPEDTQGFRLISEFRFDKSFASGCKAQEWRRCKGLGLGGQIANEGWGQGEGRSTAVGVAGMLARLAAAANGAAAQAYPHLVDHIGDAQGKRYVLPVERLAEPQAIGIDPALAKRVLQGMASHQNGGTADDACANVFGAKSCNAIAWIAGKTGTPPFHFDQESLAQIQKTCPKGSGKLRAECNVLPYKWYVAVFKTQGFDDAPYDKAIAVLSERNWVKKTGKVQAPGDTERNLSAELALRIIKTLRQEPETPPPAAPAKPAKAKP